MKKLLLITTGGTIACEDNGSGLSPEHSGKELLPSALAEDIEINDLFALDSGDISPEHWRELHGAVTEAVNSGKYRGIVIFHGTDTLEYTAALLYYTVKADIPVIITGSMLPMTAADSDGAKNAADALLCAGDPAFAGVYAVFAGRIISAGDVIKRFSAEKDAFRSFSGGDCGYIADGRAVLVKKIEPERVFPFPEKISRIAVIKLTPFTSPEDIKAEGCAGAVLESFGAGGLPERLTKAAGELTKRVPVIMTTPCTGGADLNEYETGRRALKLGIRDGGKMTAARAAVRLFVEVNANE